LETAPFKQADRSMKNSIGQARARCGDLLEKKIRAVSISLQSSEWA